MNMLGYVLWYIAGPNFAIEYRGEIETAFENIFGNNLGPKGNQLTKKRGSKISRL
jgi:hypothetical protein